MVNARRFVISISCAVLSAAYLAKAQAVKRSEAHATLRQPAAIQELDLQPQRLLPLSLQAPALPPSIDAPDLSRYRGFQLGMSLLAVAKQADMDPSDARVMHQRPAVIEELEWRPQRFLASSAQADSADPVQEILFSFYNRELFRMVINYDRYRTEGLTDEDMVEAISTKYGTATRPAEKIVLFSSFQVYNESESVIARWEDSEYSFNLFRSSYQPTFGMLVFSKRLDPRARAAMVEAIRLDEQEAPQRAIERQKKQDEEKRAEQEKARLVNKVAFRP